MGTFGITEFTVEQQQLKLSTCGIDLSTLLPSILMPRISQVSHMDHCTTMAFRQKPRRDLDFFFILSIKSCQIPHQHTFWICLLSACLSLPPFPWSPTTFSLLFFFSVLGIQESHLELCGYWGHKHWSSCLCGEHFYPQSYLPILMRFSIHINNGQSCCGTLCRPVLCLGWI